MKTRALFTLAAGSIFGALLATGAEILIGEMSKQIDNLADQCKTLPSTRAAQCNAQVGTLRTRWDAAVKSNYDSTEAINFAASEITRIEIEFGLREKPDLEIQQR